MITLGYITKLNDPNSNIFEVRVPLLEKAGSSKDLPDLSGSYFKAVLCHTPGQYNSYVVGDCVVVGFLNEELDEPIILGKLFLGTKPEQIEHRGFDALNSLQVKEKVQLPNDTSIGALGYDDLLAISRAIDSLGDQILTVAGKGGGGGGGTTDTNISIILGLLQNINGKTLSGFSIANNGNPIMVGNYLAYKVLYGQGSGATALTKEQAATYMENMTGSDYVPEYHYSAPHNSYLVIYTRNAIDDSNGLMLKPQWDASNGLLLYLMRNIAVEPNPTLVGDEQVLRSIRIGGAKFIVGETPRSTIITRPCTWVNESIKVILEIERYSVSLQFTSYRIKYLNGDYTDTADTSTSSFTVDNTTSVISNGSLYNEVITIENGCWNINGYSTGLSVN